MLLPEPNRLDVIGIRSHEKSGKCRNADQEPGHTQILLSQLDNCRARPAFGLSCGIKTAHVRIRAKKFVYSFFQNSHSVAVNDSYSIDGGESGRIEEFIHLLDGFFGALPDYVQLPVAYVPSGSTLKTDILRKFWFGRFL